MLIENNQRDLHRLTVEGRLLITAIIIIAVILVAGVIHTLCNFIPAAESILREQAIMQSRLDQLQAEQNEMRGAVDVWKGYGND